MMHGSLGPQKTAPLPLPPVFAGLVVLTITQAETQIVHATTAAAICCIHVMDVMWPKN